MNDQDPKTAWPKPVKQLTELEQWSAFSRALAAVLGLSSAETGADPSTRRHSPEDSLPPQLMPPEADDLLRCLAREPAPAHRPEPQEPTAEPASPTATKLER